MSFSGVVVPRWVLRMKWEFQEIDPERPNSERKTGPKPMFPKCPSTAVQRGSGQTLIFPEKLFQTWNYQDGLGGDTR